MRRPLATIGAIIAAVATLAGSNASIARNMEACWKRYAQPIDALAQRHAVSQATTLALIYHESGCARNAARYEPGVARWPEVIRRAAGDPDELRFLSSSWGVAQVLGITARGMGYTGGHEEFKDRSLEYGLRYLSGKYRQWGNWNDALAAYNGGDGAVRRHRRLRTYGLQVDRYVLSINVLRRLYALPIVEAWRKQEAAR
jgi:soluble lytic murein transglycosylase-like protein